jgi:hypothetical protein
MTIIKTITTTTPEKAALACSAILAADKGVPSEVRQESGGWIVECDDGRAILFTTEQQP